MRIPAVLLLVGLVVGIGADSARAESATESAAAADAPERIVYQDAAGAEHVCLVAAPPARDPAGLFVYAHGAAGLEEQGMDPLGYARTFARLRTLLAARGWVYACPRDTDFPGLVDELVRRYGTHPVVLAGASAGGRAVYQEALARPASYAGLILLCPAVREPLADSPRLERVRAPLWLASGAADLGLIGFSRALAARLAAQGARYRYTEIPGGNHDAPLKQADWSAALDFIRGRVDRGEAPRGSPRR